MNLKDAVLEKLKNVIDPDLNQDIVSLGFIKQCDIQNDTVDLTIELTTPACPVKDILKQQAHDEAMSVDGINTVNITMTAQNNNPIFANRQDGLKHIKSIIAVSSCKGGVGKSTVAVNYAFALASQGAKVGIFDADVYGPSLPTMIDLDNPQLTMEGDLMKPFEFAGIKCMSFGYTQELTGDSGPAVLRGPMVSQIISQLLAGTDWGDLDYLIMDLPPGTGDIQITLAQVVPITAAIIVTTPQRISVVDVVKGIEMFDKLNVPVLTVVENMAYYQNGKNKDYIFGQGALNRLINEFGYEKTFQIPIESTLSTAGDSGFPFFMTETDSEIADIFRNIAEFSVREVAKLLHGSAKSPELDADERGIILRKPSENSEKSFDEIIINPLKLRFECPCAHCVDEFTNEKLIKESDINTNIFPENISPVGNYAVGIHWNDGHASLYPFKKLLTFKELK